MEEEEGKSKSKEQEDEGKAKSKGEDYSGNSEEGSSTESGEGGVVDSPPAPEHQPEP